jgi:hypothetical protein
MNPRVLLLAAACVGVVATFLLTHGGGSSNAGTRPAFRPVKSSASSVSSGSAGSGYDNFKLIHTRNVFDPDRRPVRTGPPSATPPPARNDYVALTGTFFDGERKQLAFFSGSRPEYNKVLAVRDQIAGATINKITGASVEVVRNGRPITVAVGQTVPFDNSAPAAAPGAAPTAAPVAPAAAAPGAGAAPAPGAPAAPPGGGPDAVPASPSTSPSSSKLDEIRRRMEERRRQEQK